MFILQGHGATRAKHKRMHDYIMHKYTTSKNIKACTVKDSKYVVVLSHRSVAQVRVGMQQGVK